MSGFVLGFSLYARYLILLPRWRGKGPNWEKFHEQESFLPETDLCLDQSWNPGTCALQMVLRPEMGNLSQSESSISRLGEEWESRHSTKQWLPEK